ncbi:metacaspase-1-like [Nymphaea colorata]|nr:metacaspase-1-like [Nymphaea colorata]
MGRGQKMNGKMMTRCSTCDSQLHVQPGSKKVWCSTCGSCTRVRMRDRARRAITWLKGFVNAVANPNSSYINGTPQPSFQRTNGSSHLGRLPSFPSAHGSKRALLCGVSYRSRSYELQGTINDVMCMKYLLCQKFGFPEDCILMLTEDESDPSRWPTKQNIRMAMRWLVQDCHAGDSLVFHFSGHGSQQPDYNGDEIDGYDETLCPLDFETAGTIVDDEINETIVRNLHHGVRLHAIIDACHSGTALDLPYVWKIGRSGLYELQNQHSSLPAAAEKGTSGGEAWSFCSCDDHQTSADTSAFTGNTMTGAMTYSFIHAIENKGAGATYGSLMHSIQWAIRNANLGIQGSGPISSLLKRVFGNGLAQEPLLSSSEPFDIYQKPFYL